MPLAERQLRRGRASQAGRIRRTGTRRQRQEHLLLPAQIAIWDTNRDRPSGRSFFVLEPIPPPRNFAKIHARGGRGLQPEQPKDSIPPWGHSGTRRRGAAAVPEPGGRGGKAAVCRGGLDAGGLSPARRVRYAGRNGGRFRRGKPGRSYQATGCQRGAGGAWPRGAHKGRVSGATARGGRVAGRRGAGGIRRLSGVDAGKARAGAAVYGGRGGYSRGRRASYRDAAGGGAGRAKNALSCAACVGLRAPGGNGGSGAGKKARFRHIRKRFCRGAGFVDSELIYPQKLVALVGLLFRRRRVMNVSRRAGRAKSPAGKRNATQRKEHTQ